tara:strand:+ start:948 stop:1397 length:450 start_codon:yes stop_codon:yes gene_type:complete
LNFLLSLNKKLFLLFSLAIFLSIFFLVIIIYFNSKTIQNKTASNLSASDDITKPKFSINSDKQKISVTAEKGNFISIDKILLEKDVIFKSNEFKIYTNNVIFDKKNLVASSKDNSKFISENALIHSKGFDIIEKGNIINFKGKTKLILR